MYGASLVGRLGKCECRGEGDGWISILYAFFFFLKNKLGGQDIWKSPQDGFPYNWHRLVEFYEFSSTFECCEVQRTSTQTEFLLQFADVCP